MAGELTPAEVRSHGGGVLSSLAAVELDTVMRRTLTDSVKLSDDMACSFVAGLSACWPDSPMVS